MLLLALAVLAAAVSFVAPSTVQAQEAEQRPGLLNRLFGFKPAYRIDDRPAEVTRPKAERAQRKNKARAPHNRAAEPQVAVVTKRPDARVVLVVGDFLGSGLAEGLATAFTQSPNVRVVDRTSGSSGFVREDFHNWPEKINELITAERPAAIVVMIGANDRQQMLVDGVRETVRSANWNKEYAERAEELAKAIAARKVPFLWVGMPPFKSSKMMLDMLAFNDIYRVAAAGAGGEFIDIWDGFVDENEAYMSNGPDINGQPARLRAADGINLARPGKRKVAFYAEKPLYKLLGIDPAAPAATALSTRSPYRIMGPFGPVESQAPSDIDVVIDPNDLGPLDPARPVALRTPALDGGVELLGMIAEPRHEARTPAEKLAIEGIAPAPVAGRADQFAWPQLASAATALRAMHLDRTTNKIAAPSVLSDPAEDMAEPRTVRADALAQTQPQAPLPAPPAIQPDRMEEISPVQAAPAIAAAPAPATTPATIDKAIVRDVATGDYLLDLSPSRGAPHQAYKRPKTIGPEPNRAPTAVPQPVEEIFTPAEGQEEIPSASNADGASETTAEAKQALPDTAPAKNAAPSVVPEFANDLAPARAAPRKADLEPVAALATTKDAPTELLPAPEAPKTVAPNAPVDPMVDVSMAKAAPSSVEPADVTGNAPAKPAPAGQLTVPAQAPVQNAPSVLPIGTGDGAQPSPATPAAPAPAVSTPESAQPGMASDPSREDMPATTGTPTAPPAPAAPTALPENAARPASPGPAEEAAKPTKPVSVPGKAAVTTRPAVQPISADGASSIRIVPSAPAGATPAAPVAPQP